MKHNKLIVFDSNAYIDLAGNKWLHLELLPLLRKIKKAENEKGYQPLINLTVARELMSHLLDRGNGNSYTKSCTAMYLKRPDGLIKDMEIKAARIWNASSSRG